MSTNDDFIELEKILIQDFGQGKISDWTSKIWHRIK